MNIIVVDDEFYIVQGLVKTTNWESLGIENVYSAYSVKQAQKIMETNQIDILLTDIEMPGESGFDLIDWVKSKAPDVMTIILTSHQRFDYAHKAIERQCSGYILKPIEKYAFERELKKMIEANSKTTSVTVSSEDLSVQNNDKIIKEANENNFIKNVQRLIYNSLGSSELNRNYLASALHMNPDYLSFLFHEKFGQTLSSYITALRIDTAKELLSNTSMTLQSISDHSGFSDCSYFHRQFKKTTGMTPQQYRNMNK